MRQLVGSLCFALELAWLSILGGKMERQENESRRVWHVVGRGFDTMGGQGTLGMGGQGTLGMPTSRIMRNSAERTIQSMRNTTESETEVRKCYHQAAAQAPRMTRKEEEDRCIDGLMDGWLGRSIDG